VDLETPDDPVGTRTRFAARNGDLYEAERAIPGLTYAFTGFGDPSTCYRLEATNTTSDPGVVAFEFFLPIHDLGPNQLTARLDVELVDSNDDGDASMLHRPGVTYFQSMSTFVRITPPALRVDLGFTDLTEPGIYEFEVGPVAGATAMSAGWATTFLTFILSAGDTVLVRSKIVLDDGTVGPVCEVPGLPFVTGCSLPGAILGTEEPDVLDGTPGDDIICGGQGADTIDGQGGDDRIFGGPGQDVIAGGAGHDFIHGEAGNDVICGDLFAGAPGRDVGTDATACVGDGSAERFGDEVFGDGGRDFIGGGPGADVLHGGAARDRLVGGPGRDRLFGDEGADRLAGGTQHDVLDGGPDADRMLGDSGDDELLARDGIADVAVDGGAGTDSAQVDDGLDPVSSTEIFLP
jgi:Ca2+-binding RTX toxin-like protein